MKRQPYNPNWPQERGWIEEWKAQPSERITAKHFKKNAKPNFKVSKVKLFKNKEKSDYYVINNEKNFKTKIERIILDNGVILIAKEKLLR